MDQSTPPAGFDPALAAALGASAAVLEAGAESFAKAASNIGSHHGVSVRSVTRPFRVESLPNGLPAGYDASQVGALRTAATVFVRTYGVAYLLRKGAAGAYPDARAPDVDICSHLVGGLLELSTKATNWASKLCLLASPGEILDALELTIRIRVPGDIERLKEELKKLRGSVPRRCPTVMCCLTSTPGSFSPPRMLRPCSTPLFRSRQRPCWR